MRFRTLDVRRSVSIAIALVVLAAAPLRAQALFPAEEDLSAMLKYLVQDGETEGIVVGILESDGSTRVAIYGDAGPGARLLSRRSVFEIGSITKTFTGTLLADMVAKGEVALDDPVSDYLPDDVRVPAFEGREITLLDLATHSSGLPGAPDHRPADPLNPWADWTVDRLYAWLATHELERAPGTAYEYSNLGMGLLGHALSRAGGGSLEELMRERIFEPLGMDATGYEPAGEAESWAVRGHQIGEPVPHWSTTEAIAGAGGLASSMEDMLAYLKANVDPAQTDLERAMRVAQEPRRPADAGESAIGLAWISSDLNGHTIVRHGGSTGGFQAELAFDPVRRVGIAVLTNSGDYQQNLGLELIAGGPPPSEPETAVASETLASYAGEYESDGGLPLFIDVDDEGHLTGQVPSQIRFRLYPTSDSSFYAKRVPFTIAFHGGEQGVEELVLGLRGRTNRFARIGDRVPESGVVAGNVARPLSPAEIARYEGTYDVEMAGGTRDLEIYGQDDRLMANLAGQTVSPLIPREEHEFVPATDPQARLVFDVREGRAVGVTLIQNGRRYAGTRREPMQ